jgi:hypothetical protein
MAIFWVVAPCSLVDFYNPEDSHLRTHRRENLKSYLIKSVNMLIDRKLLQWERH